MKLISLLPLLLSLSTFAQTDWTKTYEQIEYRDEKLSFDDYTEACEQGIEGACSDGWYYKIQRPIESDGEKTLDPIFINKVSEVCRTNASKMCEAGLDLIRVPLDNANREGITGLEEANQVYQQFSVSNCLRILKQGGETHFCSGIIKGDEAKRVYDELVQACLSKKDAITCDNGLRIANNLQDIPSFLREVCEDLTVIQLPLCLEHLQSKERTKARSEEMGNLFIIIVLVVGGIILLFVTLSIYSTKCSQCKKFFAIKVVAKDYKGTSFQGQKTENVKTGEIRDSNYNTIATVHQNVRFNIFKKNYNVTYRCSKCGYQYTTSESTTSKVRA